jgi:hypothetical protein
MSPSLAYARVRSAFPGPGGLYGIRGVHAEVVAAAALGPDRLFQATFAVSPEAMQSAQPGTYQIQAVLERRFWPPWGWHGRAVSGPVTVLIDSDARVSDRDRHSQERLILSARYYLASHQPDAARKAAAELTARIADS